MAIVPYGKDRIKEAICSAIIYCENLHSLAIGCKRFMTLKTHFRSNAGNQPNHILPLPLIQEE